MRAVRVPAGSAVPRAARFARPVWPPLSADHVAHEKKADKKKRQTTKKKSDWSNLFPGSAPRRLRACAHPPGSRPSPPAPARLRRGPYPAASSLKARRFPSSTSSQSHPNRNCRGQLRPPSCCASSPPGRSPPLGALRLPPLATSPTLQTARPPTASRRPPRVRASLRQKSIRQHPPDNATGTTAGWPPYTATCSRAPAGQPVSPSSPPRACSPESRGHRRQPPFPPLALPRRPPPPPRSLTPHTASEQSPRSRLPRTPNR